VSFNSKTDGIASIVFVYKIDKTEKESTKKKPANRDRSEKELETLNRMVIMTAKPGCSKPFLDCLKLVYGFGFLF